MATCTENRTVDGSGVAVAVINSIGQVDAADWNALVKNRYPFLRHEFLWCLEKYRCVGEAVGWVPGHLVCKRQGELVGAMPLYEKYNSWGEFVFDHAWADAYRHFDLDYYPKLVNAIPFTPASGQRVLAQDSERCHIVENLVAAANALTTEGGFSGVHSLFPDTGDFAAMCSEDSFVRNDCQFHWHNNGYAGFEDFLSTLKAKKRKNIRRERGRVRDAGIALRWIDGGEAQAADWADFTRLYQKIYDRKYGMPAFNAAFFAHIAKVMPEQIHIAMAYRNGQPVAGALMYSDQDTLYGRHWGCDRYLDCLHFETCYYQGIEYCIRRDLKRFDPGAQGEHKVARGFMPVPTRSLHWLVHSPLRSAIEDFTRRERRAVQNYIQAVSEHSPYAMGAPRRSSD